MSLDMNYQCYTEQYNHYTYGLIIPAMLVYLLVFPVYYLLNIKMNSNKLYDEDLKSKYGLFYNEYKYEKYPYNDFFAFIIKILGVFFIK